MTEFRIEANALSNRREVRVRLLSWGTVLSLIAVTVLIFILGVLGFLKADSDLHWLTWLAVPCMLGAVIGATILAFREVLRRAEREMVFVLDDEGIVRRRDGWPEVKIAFSEVDTLREELRYLIVYSTDPYRKIAVPREVNGFDVICAEVAKHHPLSVRMGFPLKSIALLAVSILSWAAVMCFSNLRIVIPAGAIALMTLASGSHHLWTLLHRSSKRPLLWTFLGFSWLVAFLLIYFRVVRP
jgi:Na+/melibiose symporter-like transporter